MKKNTLLILAIILFGAGIYAAPRMFPEKTALPEQSISTSTPVSAATSTTRVATPIKTLSRSAVTTILGPNIRIIIASSSYPIYAPVGSSVMDAMRILASSTDLRYTGHQYSGIGTFIDSINGKENGNGLYWFLYMNGKSSQAGASQALIHPGDVIEWRFEKSQ